MKKFIRIVRLIAKLFVRLPREEKRVGIMIALTLLTIAVTMIGVVLWAFHSEFGEMLAKISGTLTWVEIFVTMTLIEPKSHPLIG